jgi:hypothetical protein
MHLMPWELDDAMIAFQKIATIKRYINESDTIIIESCLNLSSYIINWETSQLPKQFFIDKYNHISKLLYEFTHNTSIYDKNELYGHLDFQRELIESNIDYYLSICPDVYFHPHTILYLIEGAKQIKDKYFLITPEIPQLWDSSWNMLVNKNYKTGNYSNWENQNLNNLIYMSETITESPIIEKINEFKWAGWFDLYNKNFYENLVPIQANWHGYGPWDFFGINICTIIKNRFNVNVEEYVLRNQIIFDKDICLHQGKKNPSPYKKYLVFNEIPNQRHVFESNFDKYMQEWFESAKSNKII